MQGISLWPPNIQLFSNTILFLSRRRRREPIELDFHYDGRLI